MLDPINGRNRIIAAGLAWLLFISVLAACADSGRKADSETGADLSGAEETEADTRVYPDLPEISFDGYTFNSMYWEVAGWSNLYQDVFSEVETGDLLNDAVYRRNATIEDKYNVKFTVNYVDNLQFATFYKKSVMAADHEFDVSFTRGCEVSAVLFADVCYDLTNLNYINWDNPWWDQNSLEEFSFSDYKFFVTSDITLRDKASTACVFFNKTVQTDFKLGNFYDMVYDNTWTIENMDKLTVGIKSDLNGNGVVDNDDRFGYSGLRDTSFILLLGGGGRYASKDENNMPQIAFEDERTFNLVDDIVTLMNNEGNYNNAHVTGADAAKIFSDNRSLFMILILSTIETLRNMEADFGILPIPKYTEDQKNYLHCVSIHPSSIMSIPKTTPDPDRTAIILEAWAAESRYTVIDAYYEIALKDKYSRDAESTDMLDIILENRVYDIGEFFALGGFNWVILEVGSQNNHNIASQFQKYRKAMQGDINKIIKIIEKLDS